MIPNLNCTISFCGSELARDSDISDTSNIEYKSNPSSYLLNRKKNLDSAKFSLEAQFSIDRYVACKARKGFLENY
jgi:hypothetical protein